MSDEARHRPAERLSDGAGPPTVSGETFDRIARDLQALRASAGHVSYAEIAVRIARRREENGAPATAARLARSTVYDAFRPGRARVNAALVGEVALALGASEEDAAAWVRRCVDARKGSESGGRPEPAASDPAVPDARRRPIPWRWLFVVSVVVCATAANVMGEAAVAWLGLPLYLDMVGTAVAAFALGPWWGALVGIATNLLGAVVNGEVSLPFALVNVVGALVWGYGVRWRALKGSPSRFLLLNAGVALACSLVAVPLTLLVFGGETGHATDLLAERLRELGRPEVLAVFSSNLLTSLADKIIAGFAALAIVDLIAHRWDVRLNVRLPTR